LAHYLIIAASSCIGQAVVKKLSDAGHTVFTTARNTTKITPNAILNATRFTDVEEVFKQAGNIDGVVNCCGSLWLRPAHLTKQEEYQEVIDASLTTAFAVVRAAGKYMTTGGSVVLISSAAATVGLPNHEAIAAAKAGIHGLVVSAAATYAPIQLRFNVVAPGLIDTPLTASITQNEMVRKSSAMMHPLGRIGEADDIANAIVFLLDSKNSWITGQVLAVDGGLSNVRTKVKI
jgi:NAD(P)-dependent dehydrogenase (short-subunit alcohol dehydrogenase family)